MAIRRTEEAGMQPLDGPHGYYRMREAQEREMAAKAKDDNARHVHLALAEQYKRLADCGEVLP
jgi:hypothetical protein